MDPAFHILKNAEEYERLYCRTAGTSRPLRDEYRDDDDGADDFKEDLRTYEKNLGDAAPKRYPCLAVAVVESWGYEEEALAFAYPQEVLSALVGDQLLTTVPDKYDRAKFAPDFAGRMEFSAGRIPGASFALDVGEEDRRNAEREAGAAEVYGEGA